MGAKTILVIEDNEMNMKLMRAMLAKGNYNVLEAADAETGIRLAREQHPDLVLMDIQLPGMDGLSATKIIKGDENLRDIPVFAISGLDMESEKKMAMDIGFAGYIVKPFSVRSLLETLDEHFRVHRMQGMHDA